MPGHDTPTAGDQHAAAARTEARRAIFQLARDSGARTVTRPLYHGAETTTVDVEPLAGARAARHLEFAAHAAARDYIRQAREAGHGWDRIGRALDITPNDGDHAGTATAEAAYTYAAGSPGTDTAVRYGRSVTWRCRSCGQLIDDRGLIAGPLDNERGHARACPRLGAALAEWDADWEAEP